MPADPLRRYVVRNIAPAEHMCAFAPDLLRDMMHEFVRNVSPDWSTVHLAIARNELLESWVLTLEGRGHARPGADRG